MLKVRAASALVGFPGARLFRKPHEDLQDLCPWERSAALSYSQCSTKELQDSSSQRTVEFESSFFLCNFG